MNMESVNIQTETIKLDAFLKLAQICASGGEAKQMVFNGRVKVNGEGCMQRGKKLKDGDVVSVEGRHRRWKVEWKNTEEKSTG